MGRVSLPTKKQILLRREHEKVVRLMRELEGKYIKKERGWWGRFWKGQAL